MAQTVPSPPAKFVKDDMADWEHFFAAINKLTPSFTDELPRADAVRKLLEYGDADVVPFLQDF